MVTLVVLSVVMTAVMMVIMMVLVMIMLTTVLILLHKHLVIARILAMLSILAVGRKAGGRRIRRKRDRFGSFL
jgi:hypothetical protein